MGLNLTVSQLLNILTAFYGTQIFIIQSQEPTTRLLSNKCQSIPSQPIFLDTFYYYPPAYALIFLLKSCLHISHALPISFSLILSSQ